MQYTGRRTETRTLVTRNAGTWDGSRRLYLPEESTTGEPGVFFGVSAVSTAVARLDNRGDENSNFVAGPAPASAPAAWDL